MNRIKSRSHRVNNSSKQWTGSRVNSLFSRNNKARLLPLATHSDHSFHTGSPAARSLIQRFTLELGSTNRSVV